MPAWCLRVRRWRGPVEPVAAARGGRHLDGGGGLWWRRRRAELGGTGASSVWALRSRTGIGTEWKWKTGVVAHTAGPYAPCGIVGTGRVTFGAANPTAPEIAAASRSGVVLLYSPETGKQVRSPYYAAGAVSGVDYSRDGTKLVVAGDTGVQIVWVPLTAR